MATTTPTVVTKEQLNSLATAQKSYIDAKDAADKKTLQDAIGAETSARQSAISAEQTARQNAVKTLTDSHNALKGTVEAMVIPTAATSEDMQPILALFNVPA